MSPTVSFVVPCYRLAHLLPECISSILSQTYDDFEILIMDDCSPDDTAQVAQSFHDRRVRHVRNDANLGHLRNYNKGIDLCRGKYVWLISADDCLRRPYALERYVQLMERHPNVGYAVCPAVGLENGCETAVLTWTVAAASDGIVNGRRFLSRLIDSNCVATPSGMVRKECYERLGTFPLDLPYAGDWYLWCAFALHYDVAYFSEPLVNYRLHALSMTNGSMRRQKVGDLLAVRWRITHLARRMGYGALARQFTRSLAHHYGYCLVANRFNTDEHCMSFEEFEASVRQHAAAPREERRTRARAYAAFADGCYRHGEPGLALRYYSLGLRQDAWMPKIWTKYALVRTGALGRAVRQALTTLRDGAVAGKSHH